MEGHQDVCLVLRLPVGLASSLLSSAESRKTFLRLVQRLGPSSLTSEDQILLMKLLMHHSDLFFLNGVEADSVLLDLSFSSDGFSAESLQLLQCLLIKWKEHILQRQASEITSNTSAASPSPLTCAFSSQFHNDIQLSCADSHKSCLSLASRASAFESAITKLELCALKTHDALFILPGKRKLNELNEHIRSKSINLAFEEKDFSENKRLRDSGMLQGEDKNATSEATSSQSTNAIHEDKNCEKHFMDSSEIFLRNLNTKILSFASKDSKKLVADRMQDIAVTANRIDSSESTKNLAGKLRFKLTCAFNDIVIPYLEAELNLKVQNHCLLFSEACTMYSFAVKASRIINPQDVADEVFADLVDMYLSPTNLEEMTEHPFSGDLPRDKVRSVVVFFFLGAIVHGRLLTQLPIAAASRRLVRAVEICSARFPSETVSLVIAPCLLPQPEAVHPLSVPSSSMVNEVDGAGTSSSNKHLYELVNRIIRQDILSPSSVNQLIELVFSLHYSSNSHKEIDVSTLSLASVWSAPMSLRSTNTSDFNLDSTMWQPESQAGVMLRTIFAQTQQRSIQDCLESVCSVAELLRGGSDSGSNSNSLVQFSIKQPCFLLEQIDSLKCLASMLIPLLSKKILEKRPLELILHRIDEATVQHSSVAEAPPTANILHALVIANKNSGFRVLDDSLEELQSILIRSQKSIVARNALNEVKRQLERREK